MEQKSTIAYLCPNGYLGGAERFVVDVCHQHLSNPGIDAFIIFFSDGTACDEAKKLGIVTYTLKDSIKLTSPKRLWRGIKEIRKIFKKKRVDLIHATMPYSHIVGFFASFRLGIKRVWYQHGPVGGTLDRLASFLPVQQVLFNSHYLMKLHNGYHPSLQSQREDHVVPCGLKKPVFDREKVKTIQDSYGLKSLILLCCGRICSLKGFEIPIKALASIKYGQLIILGNANSDEDIKYFNGLKTLVDRLVLSDRVHFLGHVDNVSDYMKACDVFIHSSIVPEPFGLVIGEAMMSECLVIASPKGGTGELVLADKTGIPFDPSQKNAPIKLQNILKRLEHEYKTSGRPLQKEISVSGREHIEKNFTLELLEQRLSKVYKDLL